MSIFFSSASRFKKEELQLGCRNQISDKLYQKTFMKALDTHTPSFACTPLFLFEISPHRPVRLVFSEAACSDKVSLWDNFNALEGERIPLSCEGKEYQKELKGLTYPSPLRHA